MTDIASIANHKFNQEPKEVKIASVDCWYDRSIRAHTALFLDAEGNQVGCAHYAYGQADKKAMLKRMQAYVGTVDKVPSDYMV